jgi:hypothetical protein
MSRSFAPQIIPEWAISHLGKKVRFVRQYCDGYRIWYPGQTAILDGFQVGKEGVECVIYFDDYDDHCYIVEPADLFAPVYDEDDENDYPSGTSPIPDIRCQDSRPSPGMYFYGELPGLLAHALDNTSTWQHTFRKYFTFK